MRDFIFFQPEKIPFKSCNIIAFATVFFHALVYYFSVNITVYSIVGKNVEINNEYKNLANCKCISCICDSYKIHLL